MRNDDSATKGATPVTDITWEDLHRISTRLAAVEGFAAANTEGRFAYPELVDWYTQDIAPLLTLAQKQQSVPAR